MIRIELREPASVVALRETEGVRTIGLQPGDQDDSPEWIAVVAVTGTGNRFELDDRPEYGNAVDVLQRTQHDEYDIDLRDGRPRMILLVYDPERAHAGPGSVFSRGIAAASHSRDAIRDAVAKALRDELHGFGKTVIHPA